MKFPVSHKPVKLTVIDTMGHKLPKPTAATKAKGLLEFGALAAKQIIRGGKILAARETVLERLRTCGECEFLNRDDHRCMACGCRTEGRLKNKVIYNASRCPKRFWKA